MAFPKVILAILEVAFAAWVIFRQFLTADSSSSPSVVFRRDKGHESAVAKPNAETINYVNDMRDRSPLQRASSGIENHQVYSTKELNELAAEPKKHLPSCAGRTGGGWGIDASGRTAWQREPPSSPCSWSVPLEFCPASKHEEIPPHLLQSLAPLSGLTITLLGDSTTRELQRDLAACFQSARLTTRGEPLDAFIRIPLHAPLRLRYSHATFIRSLLDSNITSLACGLKALEGSSGLSPALAEVNSLLLRAALSSKASFAGHIGDFLILGPGAWNLQRDHQGNTQPNGGHAKHYSVTRLLQDAADEVTELARFISNIEPSSWGEELRKRILWREVTALEWVPSENHPGRRPAVVNASNAHATEVLATVAGVPSLRLFQYSAWADPSRWKSTAQFGPNRFTRDGIHLARMTQPLIFRELLSALVDAAPSRLREGEEDEGVYGSQNCGLPAKH